MMIKKINDIRAEIDLSSLSIGVYFVKVTSEEQERTFKIDISKYEYCEEKEEVELSDYTIYVYTLPMILIEKLRALCQQLPEYERKGGKPRARDVFDIYSIVTKKSIDITTEDNQNLFRYIFQAKKVQLSLLSHLAEQREFHRTDWPAVEQSVSASLEDFDYYYDFLESLIQQLQPIWEE
jgi:hypothetical protein